MKEIIDNRVQLIFKIHFVWMLVTLLCLLACVFSGEANQLHFLQFGRYKDTPWLELSLDILLLYSLWSYIEFIVFWKYYSTDSLKLSVIHHVVRVALLWTLLAYDFVTISAIIGDFLYVLQCMFLYIRHGWLYKGGDAFKNLRKYSFQASIIWRALFMLPAFWYNGLSAWDCSLAGLFAVFDITYLYLMACNKPNKNSNE